eukprot:RCo037391
MSESSVPSVPCSEIASLSLADAPETSRGETPSSLYFVTASRDLSSSSSSSAESGQGEVAFAPYCRWPAVYGDRVVFVSEDDLWEVPLTGGHARRLTAGLGALSCPVFSPDGKNLAFTCATDGIEEVFVMPSGGLGGARRLTHLSAE